MQKNSGAAGLFEVDVAEGPDGRARIQWHKVEAWRRWAQLSEGCYLLRSNIGDWTPRRLWETYIQLTQEVGPATIVAKLGEKGRILAADDVTQPAIQPPFLQNGCGARGCGESAGTDSHAENQHDSPD